MQPAPAPGFLPAFQVSCRLPPGTSGLAAYKSPGKKGSLPSGPSPALELLRAGRLRCREAGGLEWGTEQGNSYTEAPGRRLGGRGAAEPSVYSILAQLFWFQGCGRPSTRRWGLLFLTFYSFLMVMMQIESYIGVLWDCRGIQGPSLGTSSETGVGQSSPIPPSDDGGGKGCPESKVCSCQAWTRTQVHPDVCPSFYPSFPFSLFLLLLRPPSLPSFLLPPLHSKV